MSQLNIAERMALVELLVLDVDGVLTDGRITYSDDGREIKAFHVRDGAGLRFWLDAGRDAAIISGRNSPAVTRRAKELGITHVFQGVSAKLPMLRRLLEIKGFDPSQVCAIGDDLPDLPLIRNVGLGVTVADGCPELRSEAHYVTQLPGGHGAVRELVEMILKQQDRWEPFVERFRADRL